MIEVVNPHFRHLKMKCSHCGCILRFHFGDVETIHPFGNKMAMSLITCPECKEKTCIEYTKKRTKRQKILYIYRRIRG